MELDNIPENSFCRVQKIKQVVAILEFFKRYNEDHYGMASIEYKFDEYFTVVAISLLYGSDTHSARLIDVDDFFIEMYRDKDK